MNEVEKELKNYINGAERMSGFDSYDSFDDEGSMSSFDDDDMEMSSFDEDGSSADGGGHAQIMSEPYIITYTNTNTASSATCIFMGFNDYYNVTATGGSLSTGQGVYGNPISVGVLNNQTGTASGYGRLIAQSQAKVFKVGKWRFTSTDANMLTITLTINFVDANGNTTTKPFNISVLKDLYQQITTAVDVTKPINFDGNTFLTFTLNAGSSFQIAAFPVVIISGKSVLNGGRNVNRARAPRLSGKNVAPVIIQTSQSVKGIAKG